MLLSKCKSVDITEELEMPVEAVKAIKASLESALTIQN
jgi:hypothetical protein